MSNERFRQLYDLRESAEPADPEVLNRRWLHQAIAKWESKWLSRLGAATFVAAFLVVLLPVLLRPWRNIIERTPIASYVFHELTNIGWLEVLLFLAMVLMLNYYSSSKIDGKTYSEHGYPINISGVRSAKNVVEYELYPRTKTEENVFFVDSFSGIFGSVFMWFVLFGAFATVLLHL
jgi:hypothetical protein